MHPQSRAKQIFLSVRNGRKNVVIIYLLHGGFSYLWRLLGEWGIGALNTSTKMSLLPQKLVA